MTSGPWMGSRQKKIGCKHLGQKAYRFYVKREIWYPVQSNDIIVALGGIEFDGESSRVACRVREFSPKGDGTETNEDGCLLARLLKEVCLATTMHMARQFLPIHR